MGKVGGYHPREAGNEDQGCVENLARVDKGPLLGCWCRWFQVNSAECLLFSIAVVGAILG